MTTLVSTFVVAYTTVTFRDLKLAAALHPRYELLEHAVRFMFGTAKASATGKS